MKNPPIRFSPNPTVARTIHDPARLGRVRFGLCSIVKSIGIFRAPPDTGGARALQHAARSPCYRPAASLPGAQPGERPKVRSRAHTSAKGASGPWSKGSKKVGAYVSKGSWPCKNRLEGEMSVGDPGCRG